MQQSGSGTPIHLFSYPGLRSIVGTYSVVHPLFRHNPLFSSLLDVIHYPKYIHWPGRQTVCVLHLRIPAVELPVPSTDVTF